jgi:hypothetical protein
LEQIAGKVIGITAAKSLRWSRFQTRSIIETNAEAGVRERQPRGANKWSSSRVVGFSGQSLPACVRLLRIDVSWGDQQIVHKGQSPTSYDSFSRTFRPA